MRGTGRLPRVPRSPISKADQELLDHLASLGLRCSRHQLERWRQHGLLPRTHVHHLGAKGNIATHREDTTDVAEALATWARPGRPWQYLALLYLYDPDLWHNIDLPLARAALTWNHDQGEQHTNAAIARARHLLDATNAPDRDPLAIGETLTSQPGSRADRAALRALTPHVKDRYPHLPARQRNDLIRTAVTWGVARHLGEPLDDDTQALASLWLDASDHTSRGVSDWPSPTREDLRRTAQSISATEFTTVRELVTTLPVGLAAFTPTTLGHVITGTTAGLRLHLTGDITTPVPFRIRAWVRNREQPEPGAP